MGSDSDEDINFAQISMHHQYVVLFYSLIKLTGGATGITASGGTTGTVEMEAVPAPAGSSPRRALAILVGSPPPPPAPLISLLRERVPCLSAAARV